LKFVINWYRVCWLVPAAGAATGQLLNTLHTPAMSYHGHKQMNRFTQWSVISFLFSGYQVS
jgi:hypothetical protein